MKKITPINVVEKRLSDVHGLTLNIIHSTYTGMKNKSTFVLEQVGDFSRTLDSIALCEEELKARGIL